MNPANVDLSIDKNHILTEALGDDNFVYDYIIDDINDRELFEEMFDDSISVDDMVPVDSLPDSENVSDEESASSATGDWTGAQVVEIVNTFWNSIFAGTWKSSFSIL